MARRRSSGINDSGITQIVDALERSNDKQELIGDTLIGFNPILQSPIVYDIIDNAQAFVAIVATSLTELSEIAANIYTAIVGNKMQEEENRREMIEVLKNIGSVGGSPGNVPPPLPAMNNNEDSISGAAKAGIFAGISSVIATRVAAMIPSSMKGMFATMASFFGSFLKFSKVLIKFAGPIGIAISVIMGLIGAIKGGIAGYKEGGVEGAIKGALIGAVDGLIGGLVKGIANALGWLLKAIGLTEIGSMLGPAVKGIFDNIYKNIKGFIDIIVGIFTLDSGKVIGGVKKMIEGAIGNIKILGSMLLTLVKELGPLIFKAIKFVLWDLPKFITGILKSLWDYLWSEEGQKAISDGIGKIGKFVSELGSKVLTDLWPWLKEKLFAGLGSLSRLFSNVLGGIFNWFGENLTWDSIKETIFEGVDLVDRMVKGVTDFINGVVDGILSFFSGNIDVIDKVFGKGAGASFEDAYKKILRNFLPDPNGSLKNPLTWVGKAIPDDIYKWANAPSKKEEQIADSKAAMKAAGVDTKGISEDQFVDEAFLLDYINKSKIKPMPSSAGAVLGESSASSMNAPIIINNMGGNVTNTNTSNVNNNTTPFEPIMAGSSLGFNSM
jgi:hypothetical protein